MVNESILFEASQKQYLEKDFNPVDDSLLNKNNINKEDWVNTFKNFNLNHKNVVIVDNGLYSTLYYIGEYVATEIFPIIDILNNNEEWGLQRVCKREDFYKKMFENEEYQAIFHPEFNPLSLYYFIKNHKRINKKYLYNIFAICYQSISFGFNDIPKELYDEVFKYSPDVNTVIKHLKEDYPNKEYSAEDELIIYRSQGSKSTPVEKAYSWTTDYNFAKRFQNYNKGIILKGTVKIKDIIDYLPNGEYEVLVNHKDVFSLSTI